MTKQELRDKINEFIYDNQSGEVTPPRLNNVLQDILSYLVGEEFVEVDNNPDSVIFSDSNNNMFFEVNTKGINYIGKKELLQRISLLESTVDILNEKTDFTLGTELDRLVIADKNGNIIAQFTEDGFEYIGQQNGGGDSEIVYPDPILPSDYFQIIIYGQSLSVSGSFSQAIDFYDAVTFQGGILTNYDPDTAGAADTYFGSDFRALPQTGTETQGKALSKIVKQLIETENKILSVDQGFTPVVNSAGTGGAAWATLSNVNSDEYRRLIESVRRGKDFALTLGKTYSVPILCYIQGENSADKANTVDQFYTKLDTLFTSLNNDIKAITGQTKDIQFIVYQIASYPQNPPATTGVPLAQLKISKDKDNVHFGCSMYQMQYTDALHGTSETYRLMGAMMGVVAKRAVVDGVKMEPIGIKSHTVQKNEASTLWAINCKMEVPVKPLVFDETVNSLYITPPTHKGFIINNSSNVNIINNVTISHGDTINIFCSENPVGLKLTYAIGGRDSGGNLRDSQGDNLTISVSGVNKRVDNWCPIFEYTI